MIGSFLVHFFFSSFFIFIFIFLEFMTPHLKAIRVMGGERGLYLAGPDVLR